MFVFVCVGGEPLAFFTNDSPTLGILARTLTSVPRPKGGLSGGAHGPPRSPLHLGRVAFLYYMSMMLLLTFGHHCATFRLATAPDLHFSISWCVALLCFYFPLSGGHRDGSIDCQRELLRCFRVSVWGKPVAFFKNDSPTLGILARTFTSVPRSKGGLAGGRMAPHVAPFTWAVLRSGIICR